VGFNHRGLSFADYVLPAADVITSNMALASLASSAKPSFLANERIYAKLANVDEETWFLRAWEATVPHVRGQLVKDEALR
jgi:hypothetical protein